MRKTALLIVSLLLFGLIPLGHYASALYGERILDGDPGDWGTLDLVASARDSGLPGANLKDLHVAWDDEYLYLMITTRNSASWDVAYGVGIDVDPGSGRGYTGTRDAWGRRISFGGDYAVDYELYFWWSGADGKITSDNFIIWTGDGWDYKTFEDVGASFVYTGDSSTGLRVLEIRIPWTALGGEHPRMALVSWIAGSGDSSAVSSVPWSSAMESLDEPYAPWYGGDEWGDTDYFTDLAEVYTAPKTIDGNLSDWEGYELVGVSDLRGPEGADLRELYVSYDDSYLYLALTTNNTASWNVVYGFGLDVRDGGYTGDTDAWGRKIGFTRGIDYEIYFWYDSGNDRVGGGNFIAWGEKGWNYLDVGKVVKYAAKTGSGLQVLEMAIPWEAIGGKVPEVAVISWVAGGYGGDSAVDTVPLDPAVDGSDWTDQDYLSNFAVVEIPIPKPELTVSISSSTLDVEPGTPANITINVSNVGKVGAYNVTVELYLNDRPIKNWTVDVPAGGHVILWYLYPYPGATGTAVFRAVVDPQNAIEEVNEDNNAASITIGVGRRVRIQNAFVIHNMYYGLRTFQKAYTHYLELHQQLIQMPLPQEERERLKEMENEVMELLKLYNEGKEQVTMPNYAFIGATKIYRAYTGLKRINRELEEMLRKAQEGLYEREKYMEELARNLTKTIDGNLDDWNVEPVAIDDTGFGQDGANLKALYVDYDDQFLYIALTTENRASWRVAYGISLDYRDGGYTTGQDSWGKKIEFSRGVDAQLYFFWNGEFFGDQGTSTITSAQLTIWNGTGWEYHDLQWVGFYNYTGGAENGLQTLEIAIPWKALGEKPGQISVVAYVTGQGIGDSAVDSLPLQDAVKDREPGQEWGDVDKFTRFATVTIR